MRDEEIEEIAGKLAEKHYNLKKEWLEVCLEFLENRFGSLPAEKWLHPVVHQFLNSQISDSYEPVMSIPKAAVKIVIVKKIILQVLSHTNISTSLYEQLTEATKNNDDLSWFHGNSDENSEENEKDSNFSVEKNGENSKLAPKKSKNRMLKLELTDGKIELKGVEMEEIFDEKLLVPGSKIILTGKVKCRRGILLLERSNCQFLGGRVESICNVDKVKKLSQALEIDLNGTKNGKNEVAEKNPPKTSKKSTRKSIEKSANQSSISPFLVKTDRKTGQILKPPAKSAKNSSFLASVGREKEKEIEKEAPPPRTPTPEPPPCEEFDPIFSNFTWDSNIKNLNNNNNNNNNDKIIIKNTGILDKNVEKSKENTEKDWTFASSSSFENFENPPPKTRNIWEKSGKIIEKPRIRELPEELINDVEIDEIVNNSFDEAPDEINKKQEKIVEKKKEWDWDRKGSEEEEITTKKRKETNDSSMMILPPCLIDKKKERSLLESAENAVKLPPKPQYPFSKTIHGPRYDGVEFPEKRLEKVERKMKTPPPHRITEHYRSVKSLPMSPKIPIKSAMKKPVSSLKSLGNTVISDVEEKNQGEDEEKEAEEEEEEDHLIVQSILSTIRRTSNLMDSAPSAQAPPTFSESERVRNARNGEEIEERNDESILECTIEQEGRMELQRWGLSDKRWAEFEAEELDNEKEDDDVVRRNAVLDYLNRANEQNAPVSEIQSIIQNHQVNCYPPNQLAPFQFHHHTEPPPPETWRQHEAPPTFVAPPPPEKRIKLESPGGEDGGMMMMMRRRMMTMKRRKEERTEEIKHKQSDNVQIYRTPFAKRIPSSDAATSSSSCSPSSELFIRLSSLHIVPLVDALLNRKFWMMSKIVVVMPTICHQVHDLKSDGIDWQLQMRVSDTSVSDVTCLVATPLLNRIFGFSVQQCKQLFNAKQFNELRVKKAEAERKLVGFKRLDLLIWIEVSPDLEKLPLILDVKTVSDALNIL